GTAPLQAADLGRGPHHHGRRQGFGENGGARGARLKSAYGRVPIGVIILLVSVTVITAVVGGAWWWWDRNAEAMKEAAKALYAEGKAAGAKLDESGCLDSALVRHG